MNLIIDIKAIIFKFAVCKKIYWTNSDFINLNINRRLILLVIKNHEIVRIIILILYLIHSLSTSIKYF